MQYLTDWLHNYAIHFGAWTTLLIAADVYKKGLPDSVKAIKILILSALVLAVVGSLFSSQSHTHYMSFLSAIVKE